MIPFKLAVKHLLQSKAAAAHDLLSSMATIKGDIIYCKCSPSPPDSVYACTTTCEFSFRGLLSTIFNMKEKVYELT